MAKYQTLETKSFYNRVKNKFFFPKFEISPAPIDWKFLQMGTKKKNSFYKREDPPMTRLHNLLLGLFLCTVSKI